VSDVDLRESQPVAGVPQEAEKLFSAAPDKFVAERNALAKKLRDEGRGDDAAAVAELRKPSAVVFAVNRAARDRPKAAQGAAAAAVGVREAQVGGEADAFNKALAELDSALDLLAEVAVAHLAPAEKKPTEAMRRRLRELLRSAVADDDAREALARGALTDELEAPGFSPYAGMPVKPKTRGRKGAPATPSRAEREDARRQERVDKLRAELAASEKELREATTAARSAERARDRAETTVARLKKKLDAADR
jgi:hypothetical protein